MAISPYTQRLVNMLNEYARETTRFGQMSYSATPGKVRDRVTWGPPGRNGGSVRCFVDRENGNILYPASWSKPAQWKTGPAIEFFGTHDEHMAYTVFTRLSGWGYQGGRDELSLKIREGLDAIGYQPSREDIVCRAHDLDIPVMRVQVHGSQVEYSGVCWAGDGPHEVSVIE